MRQSPEEQLQKAVVQYLKAQYPKVKFHHSPNGGMRPKRNAKNGLVYSPEATKLKAMGTSAGFPDLYIPVVRLHYSPNPARMLESVEAGLFIELKSTKGRISESQKEWIEYLNATGYRAVVCNSIDSAIIEIDNYLRT